MPTGPCLWALESHIGRTGTEKPVVGPGEGMGQQVGGAGEAAGEGGTAIRKGMKGELEAHTLLVYSRFSSSKWGG